MRGVRCGARKQCVKGHGACHNSCTSSWCHMARVWVSRDRGCANCFSGRVDGWVGVGWLNNLIHVCGGAVPRRGVCWKFGRLGEACGAGAEAVGSGTEGTKEPTPQQLHVAVIWHSWNTLLEIRYFRTAHAFHGVVPAQARSCSS